MRYVYTASHDLKAPITNSEGITLAPCATLPAEPQQNDVVARHHSAEEALVFNDLAAQISWPASWLPKFYKSFLLLLCLSLMTDYTHLIPANDPQRLAALQAYQLLGNTPDAVFDELVRLVAQLFEVPIALISLVAKDTVEFTGNFGLPNVRVVARPDSVCSVAVLHNTTTMFEDLHADPCQLTNQLAAQQLNLGFYAGHPLHTRTGYNIGSLCVIDHQPRTLSALEQQLLAALADIVLELFDLRLAVLERPEVAQAMWDAIHRSIGTSLTRIDTLRSLGQWEESATTLVAQQYQRSIDDEAQLVIQALRAEVRAALRQVAAA